MFDELDNPIIYPKPNDTKLPKSCNVIPVINPVQPLDFVLPDNVVSTLKATYDLFGTSQRVDNRGLNTVCQSPIYRTRNYDINFAKYLSDALATYLPAQLTFNPHSRVDWQSDNPEGYNVWNLIGVSPYFRYMEYTLGSFHYPHYDTSHNSDTDPLTRTMMSGIIYLTDNDDGATAFIDDKQHHLTHDQRDLKDWDREATAHEIYEWSLPAKGKIIVFPHGECHSVTRTRSLRQIIRFDIYYSAYTKK